MLDLSTLIKYYRFNFYNTAGKKADGTPDVCKYYKGNDECGREGGCFCRKFAEVRGLIDHIIPEQYRDLNFHNARGAIISKDGSEIDVWKDNRLTIQKLLGEFLFDKADPSVFVSREDYNKASVMDKRFLEGAHMVIHGAPVKAKKGGLPLKSMPTGKTLIGCLVLKEAIWRRLYNKNRADTYALVSYQTLKQDLRLKTERGSDLKECDWLCIDDISETATSNDFNHQSFLTTFDDFLMSRMEAKLPTILICEFDVFEKDYTTSLGYSFQKMVTAKDTWLIPVGVQNGNN